MDVDIHASIFHPIGADEPYLVVVSALPIDPREQPPTNSIKKATASSTLDAMKECERLAAAMRALLRECGDNVRTVHCRWNLRCGVCPF